MEAQGSQLTNKYAEGYPGQALLRRLRVRRRRRATGHRPPEEAVRRRSRQRPAELRFAGQPGRADGLLQAGRHDHGHEPGRRWPPDPRHGAEHVRQVVQRRFLRPDEKEEIDYDKMEALAREHKPRLIIAGASAYSLRIDFERFAKVAKEVGAIFMVDMAHYAGLIAAGFYPNPVPHRRRRHLDHAQDPARPARRHHPDEGRAREGDQFRHLPRPAGRPADARHRRQGVAFKEAATPDSATTRNRLLPTLASWPRALRRARPAHRFRPHRKPRLPA
jgi:glycine hydroxymethyltransferase